MIKEQNPKTTDGEADTTSSAGKKPTSWRESWQRIKQMSWSGKALLLLGVALFGAFCAVVAGWIADGQEGRTEFDMLSPTAIEQLIDDVEEKFGSAEVVEVELNDTWARVFVPTGDGAARFRTYTYGRDGFSTSEAGGTLAEANPDLVDLTDLDADRLATNLAQARDELGIDGEVTTRVTVADDRMSTDFGTTEPFALGERDAPPHVEIELVNEFMESASRTTDLSGDTVLHETSYKAPTG